MLQAYMSRPMAEKDGEVSTGVGDGPTTVSGNDGNSCGGPTMVREGCTIADRGGTLHISCLFF